MNHSRDKSEGVKTEIPEICDLINSHDIFALQETKAVVNIKNYCSFNSNRKGSNSGGVCIGVHKRIRNGVTQVPFEKSEDIVVVKLRANYFDLDRETYLVNVHDSPVNGSFKKRKKVSSSDETTSTLEQLQEFLSSVSLNEDVVLLGDFNARTGTLDDMLSDDHHLMDADLNDHYFKLLSKRNNTDLKINSNGRPFIELLQTSGIIILNGRTLGDIFGEPTCIQRQGVSTVDYICVSANLHDRVRQFKVKGISQYSDHRPLSMTISTNPSRRIMTELSQSDVQDAPTAFKWTRSEVLSNDTSLKFRVEQKDEIIVDRIGHLLSQSIDTASDVKQLNDDIVALYQDLANSVTTKKSGKRPNKKKWFDKNCRSAKRESNRADRNASKNPHSSFLREQHFLKKKEYRATRRRKKGKFLYDMNEKINQAGNVDWSALKQLSDQYKDEEPFDIYDLLLFHKFFNDLYNHKCGMNHNSGNSSSQDMPTNHQVCEEPNEELNKDFTLQEIKDATKKLQNNKSVSEDLIYNEMLKNSNEQLQQLLLKLFNSCLHNGVYPWNGSITTPLHKKGDRSNPDNYRAITVGSCLGKLFSSLSWRRVYPDNYQP